MRIVTVLAALVLLWLGGFAWFLFRTAANPEPPLHADGIVVLTGGQDRVETALHLLAEGRAERLLISGVGGAAEFPVLAHRAGVDPQLAPRVTIGHAAASTRGNAEETSGWVRTYDVHTLIVVTSGYHMPRALTELAQDLPGVTLIPVPVRPTGPHDVMAASGLRLLAGEYMKFLVAEAGLSSFAARMLERA